MECYGLYMKYTPKTYGLRLDPNAVMLRDRTSTVAWIMTLTVSSSAEWAVGGGAWLEEARQ